VYQEAHPTQLKEIKKYCRCIKFEPDKWKEENKVLECDEAFFNFNLEFLDFVKAKRNTLVVHGNYLRLGVKTPVDSRINKVVAVSKDSAKAYTELTGIDCGVCYNPIRYREHERPLILICACRLADKVKGGERTRTLIRKLNEYCASYNKKYLMFMFSNEEVDMPNVINMKPTIDILPYMMMSDYLVQLSDNVEGYNYSVNEMLYICKKPVVITPCDVYKELGIDNTMSIQLNFDMSNICEVVEQMFTKKFDVNYKPPMDKWDELLAKGESTYKEELNMKYRVKVVSWDRNLTDSEVNRPRDINELFEVSQERLQTLQASNQLQLEVIEKLDDAIKPEKAVRKAVKKTK